MEDGDDDMVWVHCSSAADDSSENTTGSSAKDDIKAPPNCDIRAAVTKETSEQVFYFRV